MAQFGRSYVSSFIARRPPPTAAVTPINVGPPADDLNLFADQLDADRDLNANLSADALGSYADQRACALALNVAPPADDLESYSDTLNAQIRHLVAQTDDLESYADSPAATLLGSLAVAPPADSLNSWLDSLTGSLGLQVTPPADAMATADSIGGFVAYRAQFAADDAEQYADQASVQTTALLPLTVAPAADSLSSWADTTTGIRGLLAAPLADALPAYGDSTSVIEGYVVAPPADAMAAADSLAAFESYRAAPTAEAMAQGDSVTVATGAGALQIAPPADAMAAADSLSGSVAYRAQFAADDAEQYADQVSIQTTSLLPLTAAPAADSLQNWADSPAAFESYRAAPPADAMAAADSIAGFVPYFAQVADSLTWSDSASVQTTAVSPLTASFTDPANNWADSATAREGLFAALLVDDAEQYVDTAAGLQSLLAKPTSDALAGYLDTVDGGKATALTVAFTDPLSIYADTLARSQDRLVGLTDALPIYADQVGARLGHRIEASEPLSTPVDSATAVLALRYALTDSALAIADLVDCRVGLFNEVRVALSDNLNQWLDSAAYTRQYFALKVSGELDESIDLTGEVITEQIALNGKTADNQPLALTGRVSDRITLTGKTIQTNDIAGELYIGET